MTAILILDPREVKAAAIAADLGRHHPMVCFTANHLWRITIWPELTGRWPLSSEHEAPEQCIADLLHQLRAHDPLTKLREEAARMGLRLVPTGDDEHLCELNPDRTRR